MLWELHASQTLLSLKRQQVDTHMKVINSTPILQVLKTITALNEHSKLHFKYKGWEDIRRGLAVAEGTSFSTVSLKIDGEGDFWRGQFGAKLRSGSRLLPTNTGRPPRVTGPLRECRAPSARLLPLSLETCF